MDEKDRSIRFINSDYDTLFKIPDGGTIEVQFPDHTFIARCEYLDDYHTKIGDTVFHICQFAELVESQSGTVRPEPEIDKEKAAWQLGYREYLAVERTDTGFNYKLYTQQMKSVTQGQVYGTSRPMKEAREHILETLGMEHRNRHEVSFDMVREKAHAAGRSVLGELAGLRGEETAKARLAGKEAHHASKDCR